MALPDFTMRQLLEAGVHFGHQTHRWNPKMESYIFGSRNGIHIIDLAQTVPLLHQALVAVRDVVAAGGRVLFVGTKRAASETVATAAAQSAQYYMNHRWLGGTLTNWKTISNSIKRLKSLEDTLSQDNQPFTKKELLGLTRERDKLEKALGGIKDMGGVPDLVFVIDTNKESIAIQEAQKLGIPVVAVLDSNSDPDGITYPVPGNDDAGRAITLFCDLIARSALDGISESSVSQGVDIGAMEEPIAETILADTPAAAPAPVEAAPAPAVEATPAPAAEKAAPAVEKAAPAEAPPAEAAAEEDAATGYKGLDAPNGEADDLKKITGVGPVLETKLNEMGIYHYSQIAAFTLEEIAQIDEALSFKGRIERDDWLTQATELAKG